ncbi:ABC transporter permease [Salarchaeum japonicum]|uniref:Iron ABC transporter permease n=1 Tax=Salarchaeum japonicum TaxID=555573 RepID=A0AAV3T112_9EURY|nr:iron ABC transporter permease [Salarchaeum japonicum]
MDKRVGAPDSEQLAPTPARALLLATGLATLLVLLVVFYYPVWTVFENAVLRDGYGVFSALADPLAAVTPDVLLGVLSDPFFLGAAHTLFEAPLRVPGDAAAWTVEFLATARPALVSRPPFVVLVHEAGNVEFGLFGFTAYQAVLSTVLSVLLGVPGAWVLARFEFPGRSTLKSLTILPFVLPSIMVVAGFVATFGTFGTVNDVLAWLGFGRVEMLYTLELVVLAHAFYNAPLVTRMVGTAWENVNANAVETARSLGAGRVRSFTDVVLPQLVPALAASALLTFVFTFMTFPIVLGLGGLRLATVEVWLYASVNQLDYETAAALGTLETAFSLFFMYVYLRYEARRASSGTGKPLPRARLFSADTLRDWLSRAGIAAYGLVIVVVFVLPLASMVLASVGGLDDPTLEWWRLLVERQGGSRTEPSVAVWNSLLFGLGALAVALPMGVVVAAFSTRGGRLRKLGDTVLMAPIAVSGVVVGFGLLQGLVFGVDIGSYRVSVVGPAVVVMAHAVAGYPFVVRNVAPMLADLDDRLVEAARSLGADRARALWDVELPLVWPGVVAGAAFAFAISIGEFDSTVILAGENTYTMPVALKRFLVDRTAGPSIGPAAAMGTVLLVVTAVSFVVIDYVGGRYRP